MSSALSVEYSCSRVSSSTPEGAVVSAVQAEPRHEVVPRRPGGIVGPREGASVVRAAASPPVAAAERSRRARDRPRR